MTEQKFLLIKYEIAALLFNVFTISFVMLSFEITLTRIFSVSFSYHYTFLSVSLSFLGLGLGGFLAQSVFSEMTLKGIFRGLTLASLFFSLSISLFTLMIINIPPNFIISSCLMFFPFFIAGAFLAAIYKYFASNSNILYSADLVGAAIGSVVTVVFLDCFGAVNTIFLIGNLSSLGSVLLALVTRRKKTIYTTTVVFLLLVLCAQYFLNNHSISIPIGSDQDKELYYLLKNPELGARIIDSRWSAFGRTDLVEFENDPDVKGLFVDGSAGTRMYRFDGNLSDTSSEVYKLRNATAYFPFYFANKGKAIIIGPGGGGDVLIALMSGMNEITAVEVNPDVTNIVRDYAEYNGGIYTKYSNVHIFVDEGRSFLRRTPKKYDVIMLNLPVTKTNQGISGYSLAENYLFTIDSFNDYLGHLNDNGYLVIVAHNSLEVYKLVVIILRVLQDRGEGSVEENMRHMVIAHRPNYTLGFPVFILKKSAFNEKEIGDMFMKSRELNFTPIYFPYVNSASLDPLLADLAHGKLDLSTMISFFPYEIEPPTDDRPFFYKFYKGIPSTLSPLLIITFLLSLFIIHVYLSILKNRKEMLGPPWFMPYYFFSLGVGFMLIEVSLVQKFILFLGHPTLAISILLFSLLLSSSVGSLFGKRFGNKSLRPAMKTSLIVGILVIMYMLMLPSLFNVLLGFALITRFLTSIILFFPLGFVMGIPLPSGIRVLRRYSRDCIVWMWCLNSVCSLLGSVSAVAIATSIGFNVAFLAGGFLYLGIFVIGYIVKKSMHASIDT